MSTPPRTARAAGPPHELLGARLLDTWIPTAVAESGPGREVLRARPDDGPAHVLVLVVRRPGDHDPAVLRAELERARSLRHPTIQRVLTYGDLGSDASRILVVTPSTGATTLATRLITRPPPLVGLARILAATARALDAIHAQGRTYGPLTPEHVLVTPGPSGEEVASLLPLWWTWRHGFDAAPAAPWRLPGAREDDPTADAFSLGALLWHGLTGAPPLEGTETAPPRFAPVSAVVPRALPETLDRLAAELLSSEEAARPRDLQVVAERLEALVHELEGGGPPIAPPMLMATPVQVAGQLRQKGAALPVPPPAPTQTVIDERPGPGPERPEPARSDEARTPPTETDGRRAPFAAGPLPESALDTPSTLDEPLDHDTLDVDDTDPGRRSPPSGWPGIALLGGIGLVLLGLAALFSLYLLGVVG